MKAANPFPELLRAFFQEWLAEQRSASIHTIKSYRDTWRLLLRFVAERKGVGVARINLAHISAGEVRAFLTHAEHGRKGTIGTRNCRLAAAGVDITVIRSWLGHVSLYTTNHYAQANLETKRRALEQVGVPAAGNRPARWKRDADLLDWLDTL